MIGVHLFLFMVVIAHSNAKQNNINYVVSNYLDSYDTLASNKISSELPKTSISNQNTKTELVKIQLYYECMCPDCRDFDTQHFKQTVELLGPYLDIHLYPYGNAMTIVHDDGSYEFKCQHGPQECYGNKLHACAIKMLGNMTQAVLFNSCLMEYSQEEKGSDVKAAIACGRRMKLNGINFAYCASSNEGSQLLRYYGEESKKAGFHEVPYILINGVQNNGANFIQDVCKAFKNPPSECNQFLWNTNKM